ncbi:CpsD/CapB family tyrosine-protein kinase [Paenibacillus whitsoniae]|uniref:non-specific protein-tyrosine kinase n=1 Tax=Paenibacillus whitsoniae TaxID=2496558 RepID=A0A430JAN0_9BACL|nr:CpsD/CapB family tyrosine-protein kinase [Paenibacillus whitsoniae]RTE08109.1 tyrosine-protein kinase family protein [Paenibacillus whitsoniae]
MSMLLKPKRDLVSNLKPMSRVSEAYRSLRTKILFLAANESIKTIVLTSSNTKEGKTLTAANLAVAFAQENKRVLLIDADIRNPGIHQMFHKSNFTGLTNILSNKAKVLEAIVRTDVPNLSILTSGSSPTLPSELLTFSKMSALIEQVADLYDFILIDSPPAFAAADSQILASLSDGIVFVVRQGKVKRQIIRKDIQTLRQLGGQVLGVVLNNAKLGRSNSSNYYRC